MRPFLLGILLSLPPSARAATGLPFASEGTLHVASAAVHAVLPMSGLYRMYLSSGGFRVLSATSAAQAGWSLEPGVRLSTTAGGLDASSVTACAVQPSTNPASGFRMFYVGVSGSGLYSVLSATSSDGLGWAKETGTRLQRNGGLAYLASPSPLQVSSTLLRLFYVADNAGANSPANYRVFSASSSDGGLTFSDEGERLSGQTAYGVSVTTLTDGRTRIYYTSPLAGQTTASRVLSAISSDGTTFTAETDVSFSTNSSVAVLQPVVVRSTEAFRWRMYLGYSLAADTTPFVTSSLTLNPVVRSMSPTTVLKSQTNVPFALTGEVFSPGPAVAFFFGSTITATGVARPNDLSITGVLDPFARSLGQYVATVTNADGLSGSLTLALTIDLQGGEVSILDNVFRPLRGGSAAITARVFDPGRLTIDLYTVSGGRVASLFDAEVPAGDTVVAWNGRTAQGTVAASGVYLVRTRGPKLDRVDKIVLIK